MNRILKITFFVVALGNFNPIVEARNPFENALNSARKRYDQAKSELHRLRNIYERFYSQLKSARSRLNSLDSSYKVIRRNLSKANSHLTILDKSFNEAKSAFTSASKHLKKLKKALNSAEKAYNTAREVYKNYLHKVNEYKDKINDSKQLKHFKEATIENLVKSIKKLDSELHELKNKSEKIIEQYRDKLEEFLSSEIVVYDFNSELTFKANLRQGTLDLRGEIIEGFAFDSTALESLLSGQFDFPINVDPISVLAANGPLKIERSDSYKNKQPPKYSYYSSRNWVEYFAPETATSEIIEAVLSGGSSIQGSVETTRQLILKELTDIFEYLQFHSINKPDLLADILSAIVEQKPLNSSGLPTNAKIFSIPFNYEISAREIPPILNQIINLQGLDINWMSLDILSKDINLNHLGFSIAVNLPRLINIDHDLESLVQKRIITFENWQPKEIPYEQLMRKAISKSDKVANLFKGISLSNTNELKSLISNKFSKGIIDKLISSLNINNKSLSEGDLDGYKVNLIQTEIHGRLKTILKKLSLGNQSNVSISEISLDLSTGAFSFQAKISHKHSLGTLHEAAKILGEKLKNTGKKIELSAKDFLSSTQEKSLGFLNDTNESLKKAEIKAMKLKNYIKGKLKDSQIELNSLLVEHGNIINLYNSNISHLSSSKDSMDSLRIRLNDRIDQYNRFLKGNYRKADKAYNNALENFNSFYRDRVKPLNSQLSKAANNFNSQLKYYNNLRNTTNRAFENYKRYFSTAENLRHEVNSIVRKFNSWLRRPPIIRYGKRIIRNNPVRKVFKKIGL